MACAESRERLVYVVASMSKGLGHIEQSGVPRPCGNWVCAGLRAVPFFGWNQTPRTFLETFGRLVPVILLVLGIVLEWLDFLPPALAINVGFWGFFGIGVLGKYIGMVSTKSPAQYDPEAGLAMSIVGIPCTVVAIADFLLYWITRPRNRGLAPVSQDRVGDST